MPALGLVPIRADFLFSGVFFGWKLCTFCGERIVPELAKKLAEVLELLLAIFCYLRALIGEKNTFSFVIGLAALLTGEVNSYAVCDFFEAP